MSPIATIPEDGPDAVLAHVAALLKVSPAEGVIERSLAAHPKPTSLVALIDIAGQIGLIVKPIKANGSALGELSLPAIVHFNTPAGGGFGVLEEVRTDTFQVWDRRTGSRAIARDAFLGHWSGVAVLLDTPVAMDTRSFRRRRLADAIAGKMEPPSIAAGPGSMAVRIGLGALLIALVALGIAAQPASMRLWLALVALLSAVGLTVTVAMTVAISDYGGPFSPGMCRRGKLVDCQSVLSSRFARLFGFPLSELGISFYAAVLLALASTAIGGESAVTVVVGAAFVASVPIALVLIGVQIAMKRVCTLCLGVHLVNTAGAAVAWFVLLDSDPSGGLVVRAAALTTMLFCLVLFFLVPYFKNHEALARLSATHGRLAASPFASLAQLMTERPTGLEGESCGIALGDGSAADELVVFLHPACNQCEPVLREVRSLAANGRVNAMVALPPKDAAERPLCEAVITIGLATGPDGFVRAYGLAKEAFRDLVATEDPLPMLSDALSLDRSTVAASAAEGRTMARRSEAFAADHVEGTPMIFFNSLPYRGPLSHLFSLLTHHFDLLPRETGSGASKT